MTQELLAIAVPVGVGIINHILKDTGRNSLRFKHAALSKQGRELVYTHDERGEVFRVKVNRNPQGEIEYFPVNVGDVCVEDIETWQKAKQILQEYIEQEHLQQLQKTQSRGLSR